MQAASVFVRTTHDGRIRCLDCPSDEISINKLCKLIEDLVGLPVSAECALYLHAKRIHPSTLQTILLPRDGTVYVQSRLPGGKGGFGSMLRAIGAQIEKTTNREACRDLSGRRLRDINEEKRLKKWLSRQAEREKEKEQEKKQRLEKASSGPSVVQYDIRDTEYDAQRASTAEKVQDAVAKGLSAAMKRPPGGSEEAPSTSNSASKQPPAKKRMLWDLSEGLDSDDDLTSDSESDDSAHQQSSSSGDGGTNKGDDSAGITADVTDEGSSSGQGPSTTDCATGDCAIADEEKEPQKVPTDAAREEEDGGHQDSQATQPPCAFDLDSSDLTGPGDLERLLDRQALRTQLSARGMKCGGTTAELAQRLWAVRGTALDSIPKHLLAISFKVLELQIQLVEFIVKSSTGNFFFFFREIINQTTVSRTRDRIQSFRYRIVSARYRSRQLISDYVASS